MLSIKPMGHKAYGSIPHLIGSRRGVGDHGVNNGAHNICTRKERDRHDTIFVFEKLDGSCCAVYRDGDTIIPVTRSGTLATKSKYTQHHLFAAYIRDHYDVFMHILSPGERAVGEWLAQAHGTRYALLRGDEPFVIFDFMHQKKRTPIMETIRRLARTPFNTPPLLHVGSPIAIETALQILGPYGRYGGVDPAEGLVYRVERNGEYDFMAKYVYPDKVDGAYLPEITGGKPVWNWRPKHISVEELPDVVYNDVVETPQ